MVEKYVVIEKGKPIDKEKKVTMNARLTVINNVIDYKKLKYKLRWKYAVIPYKFFHSSPSLLHLSVGLIHYNIYTLLPPTFRVT